MTRLSREFRRNSQSTPRGLLKHLSGGLTMLGLALMIAAVGALIPGIPSEGTLWIGRVDSIGSAPILTRLGQDFRPAVFLKVAGRDRSILLSDIGDFNRQHVHPGDRVRAWVDDPGGVAPANARRAEVNDQPYFADSGWHSEMTYRKLMTYGLAGLVGLAGLIWAGIDLYRVRAGTAA